MVFVATVLTVYGIETTVHVCTPFGIIKVATVLTVYGIETKSANPFISASSLKLQQYLPFTVLKPGLNVDVVEDATSVATVLTVYGIETKPDTNTFSMNSE